jgi:hypothetical protein
MLPGLYAGLRFRFSRYWVDNGKEELFSRSCILFILICNIVNYHRVGFRCTGIGMGLEKDPKGGLGISPGFDMEFPRGKVVLWCVGKTLFEDIVVIGSLWVMLCV